MIVSVCISKVFVHSAPPPQPPVTAETVFAAKAKCVYVRGDRRNLSVVDVDSEPEPPPPLPGLAAVGRQ